MQAHPVLAVVVAKAIYGMVVRTILWPVVAAAEPAASVAQPQISVPVAPAVVAAAAEPAVRRIGRAVNFMM